MTRRHKWSRLQSGTTSRSDVPLKEFRHAATVVALAYMLRF